MYGSGKGKRGGGGGGRGGGGAEGYSLYMLAEALVFAWKLV